MVAAEVVGATATSRQPAMAVNPNLRLQTEAASAVSGIARSHYPPLLHYFEVAGVRFGIAICHEGWRYPETVRWAAVRGAQIVFHPTLTGGDNPRERLEKPGAPEASFYEKAMECRSMENTIFFASANHALKYQESATGVISPDGECIARLPYGEPGLLVTEIDPSAATSLYASRFA
jgi:predicted amidohydrolase